MIAKKSVNKDNSMKRIAIFAYFGHIAKSPSTISMIETLAENGFFVDIFTVKYQIAPLPVFNSPNITFHSGTSRNILGLRGSKFIRYIYSAFSMINRRKYHCLIGIDQNGLIVANIIGQLFSIPVIYYSLELFYWKDALSWKSRLKKRLEILGHRQTIATIIQDTVRGETLEKENRISKAKLIFVPNSFINESYHRTECNYLQRRFVIPKDKRVILMAGGIGDWTMSKKLAQVTHDWPEEWVLIIHGEGKKDYLDELRPLCDGKHVILSDKMVPYTELDELIGSADIGLALYENWHQGIFEMSKASGKIWQYLRCGLPVITMDFPSLVDLIELEDCGICVKNEKEVKVAIDKIFADYKNKSNNAVKCYRKHGDFRKGFDSVLKLLKNI
jgi:glycosyltransferase involved in cell wall biosynthesis